MDRCPWCRQRVERLHSVPPEVVTKELVLKGGGAENADSLEGCATCISALMEGDLGE